MLTDRGCMYKSISDMLFLPSVVEAKYLLSIQVMPYGITLYRRTVVQEYSESARTIRCVDPKCAQLWILGTQLSLECAEPVMWRALADLVQQLPAWTERLMEIMRRYGLSISLFKYIARLPIAGSRQLP